MRTAVVTRAEWEQEIERVAVARFICRKGKYPQPSDLKEEMRMMRSEEMQGKNPYPRVKESEAMAFLNECGLSAPAREADSVKTGTRVLPGTVPVPKTNYPDNGKLDDLKRK